MDNVELILEVEKDMELSAWEKQHLSRIAC